MTDSNRGSFGSKIGLILATAGGAVGLGNVWRFPYTTATPCARQAATVAPITEGSPAWKPQATLAEDTSASTRSSDPMV